MKVDDAASVIPELRRTFTEIEPGVPLLNVRPLAVQIEAATLIPRLAATLSLVLAIPCIVLTAVAIYSVLSYTIAGRTAEIALRIALGAGRADIARLLVRQVASVTALGL